VDGMTNETTFRVFCVVSKLRICKATYLPFHIHEIVARCLINIRRETPLISKNFGRPEVGTHSLIL
jgi:hypothetical protein